MGRLFAVSVVCVCVCLKFFCISTADIPALLRGTEVPNLHYSGTSLNSAGPALLRAPSVYRDFTCTIPGTCTTQPALYRAPYCIPYMHNIRYVQRPIYAAYNMYSKIPSVQQGSRHTQRATEPLHTSPHRVPCPGCVVTFSLFANTSDTHEASPPTFRT